MIARLALIPFALLFTQSAIAQTVASLPDPATINVPIVNSSDQRVQQEGYKFFFFYNPSVSFADAYSDIAECRAFLESGAYRKIPGFIPWVESGRRELIKSYANPYGIVGAAIGAILAPKMERGLRNNKMRRCMEPRGYSRYPLPDTAWEQINEGDERSLVLMQAKLASGNRPQQPEVQE